MKTSLDKSLIAKNFRRSMLTYDQEAIVQKKSAQRLLNSIKDIGRKNFENTLEIGCCTGILTGLLLENFNISNLYLNDIVEEFEDLLIGKYQNKHQTNIKSLFGDIENISIPKELELIASSSTFQWFENLDLLLSELGNHLVSGGVLAFTVFTKGTMEQVRNLTGVGLVYPDPQSFTAILKENFDIIHNKAYCDLLHFSNVNDVLRHMKNSGVTGVRKKGFARDKLLSLKNNYERLYKDDLGLPLQYNSQVIVAQKR